MHNSQHTQKTHTKVISQHLTSRQVFYTKNSICILLYPAAHLCTMIKICILLVIIHFGHYTFWHICQCQPRHRPDRPIGFLSMPNPKRALEAGVIGSIPCQVIICFCLVQSLSSMSMSHEIQPMAPSSVFLKNVRCQGWHWQMCQNV